MNHNVVCVWSPPISNCRSHVSERKTLNVTISHHWNSPVTTATTVVVEDSLPTESSSVAYSGALRSDDDDDDDEDAAVHHARWCVVLTLPVYHLRQHRPTHLFTCERSRPSYCSFGNRWLISVHFLSFSTVRGTHSCCNMSLFVRFNEFTWHTRLAYCCAVTASRRRHIKVWSFSATCCSWRRQPYCRILIRIWERRATIHRSMYSHVQVTRLIVLN